MIVVDQDFINTGKLGNPSKWIQTSFNTHGGIHYNNKTYIKFLVKKSAAYFLGFI